MQFGHPLGRTKAPMRKDPNAMSIFRLNRDELNIGVRDLRL